MVDTRDKPRQSPGVVSSEVLDEIVIYCPGTSKAVSLNASACAIWELCDGSRTVDDICTELSGPAGLPPNKLHDDVSGAVSCLYELGLIDCGPA